MPTARDIRSAQAESAPNFLASGNLCRLPKLFPSDNIYIIIFTCTPPVSHSILVVPRWIPGIDLHLAMLQQMIHCIPPLYPTVSIYMLYAVSVVYYNNRIRISYITYQYHMYPSVRITYHVSLDLALYLCMQLYVLYSAVSHRIPSPIASKTEYDQKYTPTPHSIQGR